MTEPGALGEIQLTDAIKKMIQNGHKVIAVKINGIRHDIGTPIGWIKAIISQSLTDNNYRHAIENFLEENYYKSNLFKIKTQKIDFQNKH